jgi:hypothetical protein
MAAENAQRRRQEQQEAATRWLAKIKAEDDANAAWRASVGLPPSEPVAVREYPPTMRRAKNIRDLIRLYVVRYVREIKLGTMAAAADKDSIIYVDTRMPVYELKKIIQYFFQYDFKYDLVYPGFHLAGKKTLDDERSLSDYGIRNGSRLIVAPKIQTGYRVGGRSRRQRRNKNKTRRN